MRAMHSLYEDACATMTVDQVNYVERDGVLPIAFSLVHQVLIEDGAPLFLGGAMPLFSPEWETRLQLGVANHGKELSVSEMMSQRIGDYDAFLEFQHQVFDATEEFLRTLSPESLDDVVIGVPYPPRIASTFSARVGGELGIRRSDAIECWIYQHGLRHMGEIEHARALVGLTGMTS
jgi:hypothetical protein